jgi:hypothetical protein
MRGRHGAQGDDLVEKRGLGGRMLAEHLLGS